MKRLNDIPSGVRSVTCRVCGKRYGMTRNDREKTGIDTKFLNSDGIKRYYSNISHEKCPSCMLDWSR